MFCQYNVFINIVEKGNGLFLAIKYCLESNYRNYHSTEKNLTTPNKYLS